MVQQLVGVAEIAAMLGVSRQRVNQLVHSTDFPEPEAELSAGRIWARDAVEAWATSHPPRVTAPAGPVPSPAAAGGELPRCSFCGRDEGQAGKVVAGPGVGICGECVELCQRIIGGDLAGGPALALCPPGAPPGTERPHRRLADRVETLAVELDRLRREIDEGH